MCIAVPGKVVEIREDGALVSFGGVVRLASLDLVDGVQEGEYVIVHAGFVIRRVDEREAEETLALMREAGLEIH
jgi:hydrogenase expression/formation protein HypC